MCFTYPKMDAKVNLAKVCVSLTLRWMLKYMFHCP